MQVSFVILCRAPLLTLLFFEFQAHVHLAQPRCGIGHIRVHVGHEQIHQPVLVEIEKLDPHRAPRRFWKITGRFLHKPFPALIFVVMIIALHIQDVQIGKAILIQIHCCGVPAPVAVVQAHLFGNILEFPAPKIPVQNAAITSRRI